MAAKRDLYEVLGISKTADEKAIKKAYRKLAKKYHPDMNPGDKTAEQKFKEVTDAYNILSDPEKRKLYDQYGHAAFDGTGAESEFYKNYQNYGGNHGGYQEFHFEGGDGDDIFSDIFGSMFGGSNRSKGFHRSSFHQGGFGSSGGFGGSGFRSGSFKQKGSDAHADISISFDEAVTGCDKVIHLQDQNGVTQSLQVHIPAGIDTGKSVRLRGKGNPGMGGGEAGKEAVLPIDLLRSYIREENQGNNEVLAQMIAEAMSRIPFTVENNIQLGDKKLADVLVDAIIKKMSQSVKWKKGAVGA